MRTRSEEKRRTIVRVAAKAFEELGYERTSMLTIAERMKGSKQTLYNYFPSKEDLLRAVLTEGVTEAAQETLAAFLADSDADLRGALIRGGIFFLNHQLAPATMALVRHVANQSLESRIGAEFYEQAIGPAWDRFAECLESLMERGVLRRADARVASLQFKALNQLDLYERHLLGVDTVADPKEVRAVAEAAADAFLRIYGPESAA